MPSQNNMSIRQMIVLGLLIAVALVLNYFERYIPINFMLPGVKIGLANITTLLVIGLYKSKDIYLLVCIRIILASLFIGGMASLAYSMAGGLLAVTAMLLMNRLSKESTSIIGISLVGAIAHNLGQIIMVIIITKNWYVGFSYLPILLLSGIVTGIFIGYVAKAIRPYLKQVVES